MKRTGFSVSVERGKAHANVRIREEKWSDGTTSFTTVEALVTMQDCSERWIAFRCPSDSDARKLFDAIDTFACYAEEP